MPPASIVLDIEKARAARAALDGRPPPRLLRPALVPLAVALSVDERAYEAFEFRRTRHPVAYDQRIAAVRVEGARRTNPEALKREIADRVGVRPGDSVSDEQLVRAARILNGLGEFERVDVHATLDNGAKVVVIDVDEKPWGPDYLRIGARAFADFHTESRFSITLQHSRTWLNAWGAEWINEVQIGDVRRLSTSLYQPLGPGSAWFVEPTLQAMQSDYDIFGTQKEMQRILHIAEHGTSAHRQVEVFEKSGGNIKAVVDWMIAETMRGV